LTVLPIPFSDDCLNRFLEENPCLVILVSFSVSCGLFLDRQRTWFFTKAPLGDQSDRSTRSRVSSKDPGT